MADLEQRWRNEVEEYCQGNTSVPSPFFHDYHLQDVSILSSMMSLFVDVHICLHTCAKNHKALLV